MLIPFILRHKIPGEGAEWPHLTQGAGSEIVSEGQVALTASLGTDLGGTNSEELPNGDSIKITMF